MFFCENSDIYGSGKEIIGNNMEDMGKSIRIKLHI